MSQKVTVIINPKTGTTEYEINGVIGGSCTEITDLLVKANEHLETQYTQEYETPDELPDYITNM